MVEPTPQTKAEMEAGRKTLEALNPGLYAAKVEADAKAASEKVAHDKAEADAKDAAELAHAKEIIAKHEAKAKAAAPKLDVVAHPAASASPPSSSPIKDNGPKVGPTKVEPPHPAPSSPSIPPLKK